MYSISVRNQLVSSANKLFVSLMNKLAIMTTNALAFLPSQRRCSWVQRIKSDDDESFHVSDCNEIQASNDFIGILQTIRDLAYNARNRIML